MGKSDLDFYPPRLAEKYRADDRQVLHEGKRLALEEESSATALMIEAAEMLLEARRKEKSGKTKKQ